MACAGPRRQTETMPRPRSLRFAAPVVAGALILSGCASASDLVRESAPSAPGTDHAPAAPGGPDARPEVGECRPTPQEVLDEPADPTPVVDCEQQHTLETYAVVDLNAGARDEEVERGLGRCKRRLGRYLGRADVAATRVSWFYFLGGSSSEPGWLRCDVALSTSTASGPVEARSGSLRGAIDGDVPVTLRKCLGEPPNPDEVQPLVECTRPHVARMLPRSKRLGEPGSRYPGAEQLLEDNLAWCREQTAEVDGVASSRVEVPTERAWRAGAVTATCWAVAEQGATLPPLGTTI